MRTSGVELQGRPSPASDASLDAGAARFLAGLVAEFAPRLDRLLAVRSKRQRQVDEGTFPEFDTSSRPATEPGWAACQPPDDARDRRIEMLAVPGGEQIAQARASDASLLVVDLEDALPSPDLAFNGLLAMRESLEAGDSPPIILQCRALQRVESRILLDGQPIPAALADVGLLLHHANGPARLCLTGLESPAEAVFWREVFRWAAAQGAAGADWIQVTLRIDTVAGAFALEDMLYELRDFATAFSAGRHAYLKSVIHTFRRHAQFVLPDRGELTMARHFLRSWGLLQIRTAHRRLASAIAPEALYVTEDDDVEADGHRLARFRHAASQSARDGFDGIGVRDPALVPVAREIFEGLIPGPHQQHRTRDDVHVAGADLLQITTGKITGRGLQRNIGIALAGLCRAAAGESCFALAGLIEHGASVELAAAQLWQWVHLPTGILDEGRIIDAELFESSLADAADRYEFADDSGGNTDIQGAAERLRACVLADTPPDRLLQASAP